MRCSLAISSFRCSILTFRARAVGSCCARTSAFNASAGNRFRSGSVVTDMRGVSHGLSHYDPLREKKVVQRTSRVTTASCGSQVRSGRRQSMPSSSIDNCARVNETVPLVACGQMNRPLSRAPAGVPAFAEPMSEPARTVGPGGFPPAAVFWVRAAERSFTTCPTTTATVRWAGSRTGSPASKEVGGNDDVAALLESGGLTPRRWAAFRRSRSAPR